MTDTDIEQRNAATARDFLAAWGKLSSDVLMPYKAWRDYFDLKARLDQGGPAL